MDETVRKIGIFSRTRRIFEVRFLQQKQDDSPSFPIKIPAKSHEIKNRRKIGVEGGFHCMKLYNEKQ